MNYAWPTWLKNVAENVYDNRRQQFWLFQLAGWGGFCVVTFFSLTLWYNTVQWSYISHTILQSVLGLLLSLPLLLAATLLSATLLFFGIGHPQGFPWISALICGALISATDPVAVSELAKRLPVPGRLLTLMEGEFPAKGPIDLKMYYQYCGTNQLGGNVLIGRVF